MRQAHARTEPDRRRVQFSLFTLLAVLTLWAVFGGTVLTFSIHMLDPTLALPNGVVMQAHLCGCLAAVAVGVVGLLRRRTITATLLGIVMWCAISLCYVVLVLEIPWEWLFCL